MLNVTVLSTQSERVPRISQSVANQFLHTRPVGSGALTRGLSNTIAGANADSILYAKTKLGTPVGDDGGAEVEAEAGAGAGLASGGGYGPGTGTVGTDTAHLTTVLANGDRLFLRSRKSSVGSSSGSGSGSGSGSHGESSGNLLGQPMTALMEEARKVQVRCAAQRAHREATAAAAAATASSDNFDEDKELWVSKHAPHNFSQLLSSERINRDVLRAVKQWDPYVFKRAASSQSVTATNTAAKAAAAGDDKSKNGNSIGDGSSKNNDADTRPECKVILLSGPPGTGKTTLAHIIAKHCGYRPMEINASDDRSAEVLRGHVERACVGNTVTGDKRPNCLILDEIDGIDNRGSIDALTAIIRQPLKKKKGKVQGLPSKFALTRPIIAICNDQFAPVLRDLRKYAQIFTFNAPQEKRLVMRLKAIAVQEQLQVSLDALQTLAAASIGDVRSSINTLQFASLRASAQNSTMSNISEVLTSLISSGLKDQVRHSFLSFPFLFCVASSNGSDNRGGRDTVRGPLMEVMGAMQECGDAQLVLRGLFHNLTRVHYHDPSFNRSALAAEWLSNSDIFEHRCYDNTNGDSFALMAYVPMSAAAVHMLCSSDGRAKIEWPMQDRDVTYKKRQNEHILQSMQLSASSGNNVNDSTNADGSDGSSNTGIALNLNRLSHALRSRDHIVMDLLSPLMDILSPRTRPVAYITLGAVEQGAIQRAVRAMASTGLAYRMQTKEHFSAYNTNATTSVSLVLEPAIHNLCAYNHPVLKDRRWRLPYETKNNIFMELKAYLIRLHDRDNNSTSDTSSTGASAGSPDARGTSSASNSFSPTPATPSKTGSGGSGGKRSFALAAVASPSASLAVAVAESEHNTAQKRARSSSIDAGTTTNNAAGAHSGSARKGGAEEEEHLKPSTMAGHFKRVSQPVASRGSGSGSSGAQTASDGRTKTITATEKHTLRNAAKTTIRFRFNQGFSNAVRRPVSIQDFI
eukprot:GSChrysophyteH2.ASY1.ANO1.338.1 assembled CDS